MDYWWYSEDPVITFLYYLSLVMAGFISVWGTFVLVRDTLREWQVLRSAKRSGPKTASEPVCDIPDRWAADMAKIDISDKLFMERDGVYD